jgi:hypothetical protein
MVSNRYRTIFIHQRKCAGMSIIGSFSMTPQMPEWHLYNDGILDPAWAQRSAPEEDYFVFSAVRNPFDRLVSAWKYLKATRDRPLEEVLADPPRLGHDYRHFTRPQCAILRNPADGSLIVHDLIRFESLQADYDRVSKRFAKQHCQLPRVNATQREHDWRKYFTPPARALAETMFAEDLAAFEYAF